MQAYTNPNRKNAKGTLTLTLLFFIILFSNFILTIFRIEFFRDFHENRQLSHLADLNFKSSWLYSPSDIELYVNDRFAFRKPLVLLMNSFKYFAFNSSSDQTAMPAKQGWIFYGTRTLKQDYQRKNGISDQYLKAFEESVREKSVWLSKRNIHFLLLVVPNKHNIYPQYMPDFLERGPGSSTGEFLVKHLSVSFPDVVVDLFDVLHASSVNAQVYYRIDTHWNHLGAKLAAEAALEKIMRKFKLPPGVLPEMRFETEILSPGNFGRVMGVPLHERELVPKPVDGWSWKPVSSEDLKRILPDRAKIRRTINANAARLKVVVLGDSYMDRFGKYLSEAFREVISVNLWETEPISSNRFPKKFIEKANPDLVIMLFAERRIGYDQNRNSKYYYLASEGL